jgi:RNA polymerase sigma-70 factor (ECF subfamily)
MFCACSNASDTDDLAQECYLRALRNWDLFGGRGSRQAWLFAIARNTQIDWFRRKTRHAAALDQERIARAEPVTSAPGEADMIWEIVESLEGGHKEVIHLKFAAGLSYAEIADVLKVPIGTVRSRLHRGLKELRRRIKE